MNACVEDPRLAGPCWLDQCCLEATGNHPLQGFRTPGVDPGLAQVPGHQTPGVLGHVRGARDADLHPTAGKDGLRNPGCGIRARPDIDDPSRDRRRAEEQWREARAILLPGDRARRGSRPWTGGTGGSCRRGAARRTGLRPRRASGWRGAGRLSPTRPGRERRTEPRCRDPRHVRPEPTPGEGCERCPSGGWR